MKQCVTSLLLGNHPSYDVTPYDVTPYDVTPYDVTHYDVTPYDVTPCDVTPYDVIPYDVTPYDVCEPAVHDGHVRSAVSPMRTAVKHPSNENGMRKHVHCDLL